MRSLFCLASVLAFAACNQSPHALPVEGDALFTTAAAEYQVPAPLLQALAYTQTRFSMVDSASHEHGVMALSSREDWNKLERAAQLTGRTMAQLRVDPAANVSGGAAVLRELFEQTQRDDTSLSPHRLGDWYRAVSLYSGFEHATDGFAVATDVFLTLERGFEVTSTLGHLQQPPTASAFRDFAPAFAAREQALGDYPGNAAFRQSPNYSSGHGAYTYVVIHTMQGSYNGSISWFLNSASNVSSHYLVKSSTGEVTQMVSHDDTAWHAGCYNSRSIGIEHEGYIADPGTWYTTAMYTESAKLTKYIADRHAIPKDRTHIIGHNEVGGGCNANGHTDPGTGWNWTTYMNLVNNGGSTAPKGTFIGAIYTGGNTSNRVAGATVTVNGASVTTAADGLYQFSLAPGSYTATVTKAGFSMASVTRTITASAMTWGSMEVNPVTAMPGTLSGVVFAYNAAMPTDTSMRLSGATVTVNGQTLTTGAMGEYTASVPAGTYTVTATKAGYQDAQVSRTVASGQTATADLGLTATAMPDQQAPQVVITEPTAGQSLELAAIQVKGTASDDRGAITSVKFSLNGSADIDVPVTSGSFAQDVLLAPGSNTVVVRATDAAGNVGTATVMVTFRAGLDGVVFQVNDTDPADQSHVIAGAEVRLVEDGTGTVLAMATTPADGSFHLDVTRVGIDAVLSVTAAGYMNYGETLPLAPDRRSTVKVGLASGMAAVPELQFLEPMEGQTVTTDTVTVYGSVTGFELSSITVNGVVGERLGAGGFSATVPLEVGSNTLTATAVGVNGATVMGELHLKRAAVLEAVTPLMAVSGGCDATGALPLVLLALVRARRRRA